MIVSKYVLLFFIYSLPISVISMDQATIRAIVKIRGAIISKDTNKLKQLLAEVKGDEKKYIQEEPLIARAVESKGVNEIKPLLKFGANPNVKKYNRTALIDTLSMSPADIDVSKILEILLSSNQIDVNLSAYATPDATNLLLNNEIAPLSVAVQMGWPNEVIDKLIEKGANLNAKNEDGNTPLMTSIGSITSSNVDKIKYLIDKGAKVNITNNEGKTPLMLLINRMLSIKINPKMHAILDNTEIENLIYLMAKKGANINAKDEFGQTVFTIIKFSSADKSFKNTLTFFLKKYFQFSTYNIEALKLLSNTLTFLIR